jgi:hypothetical protein
MDPSRSFCESSIEGEALISGTIHFPYNLNVSCADPVQVWILCSLYMMNLGWDCLSYHPPSQEPELPFHAHDLKVSNLPVATVTAESQLSHSFCNTSTSEYPSKILGKRPMGGGER